jgi:hypothetical protein
MLIWRLGVCFLVLVHCILAETPEAKDEEQIRRVITQYLEGVAQTDPVKVAAVTTGTAMVQSAGGTVLTRLADRARTSSKPRATLIRRVVVLNPSTAVALGIWRDFTPAPFGTGTVEYTLVREQGYWRIAHRHDAFLPEPRQVASPMTAQVERMQSDTSAEEHDRWQSLFDGKTMNGWIGTDSEAEVGASWRVENNCFVTVPGGGRSSLITTQQYLFFELRFEWLAAAKANSGVKYRLLGFDRLGGLSREPLGFEYQVADDEGDPGARIDPKQRSGALYGLTAVDRSFSKPIGEWNQSRILVLPTHVEHWLNGQLTASYATDLPFASAIVLQHHTTEVRFRNISIRRISTSSAPR